MARQLRIEGTEETRVKEIDDAAEAYVEARDARMAKTEREVEAKEALIGVMKKHSRDVYRDDDATPPLIVTLVPGKDAVKVSEQKDEEEPEAEAPRVRRGRSAAAASAMDEREREADDILAKAGAADLNDPKLKGEAARHRKARTKTAAEVGAVRD
jgi:hypothetical protein